jgi:enoyl-CoA hydratase/carnithine racemase
MGWINRALPDAELTGFVDKVAHRIASVPASGIATIKSIVDQMTTVSSAVLNQDSVALWREMALPETQERVAWWLANGAQTLGPMEEDIPTNLAKVPR